MKTLGTILMAVVILAGLILAITPFVADRFFPIPENMVRQAKPEAAANALKRWFNSPDADLVDVQAIQQQSVKTGNGVKQPYTRSWFAFSVSRRPVEKFILGKKLEQKELNAATLDKLFDAASPPASWWQPAALNQQTYFEGVDQGKHIALIYNPDSKRAVLVIRSQAPAD